MNLSYQFQYIKLTAVFIFGLLLALHMVPIAHAEDKAAPEAAHGEIDLRGWQFGKNGSVDLVGQWQFYWERLLTPDQIREGGAALETAGTYVQVPHVWSNQKNDPATDNYGYATYRLVVKLGEHEQDRVKAIYIRGIASAYKLWINGRLLGGNGQVGTSLETMSPKNYAKVYHVALREGDNEIVLQTSNFVQRKGGLWSLITLGNSEDIELTKQKKDTVELIVAVALITMGCYLFWLSILRRGESLSLMLGAFCIMLAVRTLLIGNTLLVRFVPGFEWELGVKMEYLTPFVGMPLFTVFVSMLYPAEMNRLFVKIMMWVSIPFWAIVLFSPARVFTYMMFAMEAIIVPGFVYLLYVFLRAALNKREGAMLNVVGTVIMFAAVLNDLLYYNHWITSADLSPFGVLVYMFIQTMILALKSSYAQTRTQHLTDRLSDENVTLEEKIRERTKELEQSNEQLTQANEHLNKVEQIRRELMINISHELGTPMTTVQGYVKAMLDGVISPSDHRYVQTIYDKIIVVTRLIQDLFELSKLDAGRAYFQFTTLPADELFSRYFTKYKYEAEANGINFELKCVSSVPGECLPVLHVDPVRIQQVMENMIRNAIKYTPDGGSITITGELERMEASDEGWLHVKVTDNGVGIEPEVLPFVFDRFTKGRKALRTGQEGTGLGLAIAKEIVTVHGGTVAAQSEPDQGSEFSYRLPVQYVHAYECIPGAPRQPGE